MLGILRNRTFRHLFLAQIIALIGTGLMTIALGLLAYDLAGADAGAVLGTALAIKMIAYVGVAPVAQAFVDRIPRRRVMVSLDLLRAGVAVFLPFVTEIWQVYLLIFVLQAASAAFTPTFQATIPDILPDEGDYTQGLSLSRLAYDLEAFLTPMLAAALLVVIGYSDLFAGTVVGFVISALLVFSVTLPTAVMGPRRGIWDRTTRGLRLFFATPRLRGLFALDFVVAAAGAMIIVNTVVLVRARFGLGEAEVAWALSAFGAGSMIGAILTPRLLSRTGDRSLMLAGAAVLVIGTAAGGFVTVFGLLLPLWLVIGVAYSVTQTPSGRLLRRSAQPEDRPAIFAANFAVSHAAWLVCYPFAGRFGAGFGLETTFFIMSGIGLAGFVAALWLWPAEDAEEIAQGRPGSAIRGATGGNS